MYKPVEIRYLPLILAISLIPPCVEVDISVPSFAVMSEYFNTSDKMIQMTMSLDFLGFFISSIFIGPISESFGRRKIMIIGNIIMLLGALGCVFAESITVLLISRFIEGCGSSTSTIITFAIIADIYSGRKSTHIISQINSLVHVFTAIAPIIGGIINEFIGWRGNYSFIAIISFISCIILLIALPETKNIYKRFSIQEMLNDYKLLFLNKKFISTSLIMSMYFSSYLTFISCATFLYTTTFKLSTIHYTIHQAVIILAFSLVSIYVNTVVNYFGEKKTVIYSTILTVVSCLAMLYLGIIDIQQASFITAAMVAFSAADAIIYPILLTKTLEIAPSIKGTISSSLFTLRALVSAIFVIITGYLYNGTMLTIALVISLEVSIITFFILITLKIILFEDKK
ncbi:MFS transporter [Rickettsia endosymbiont of Cardiosporidium cionae]|uniref:MFS transporter n=1 Tax=Rickettsia endosymbiont of Cardiosporidium cionae TaxID=2777155 RepID=UPI0018930971|nr:MFS transporter [Rickettsia endosymbiont of Cardiosporidium cionae]KAF8818710.1 MFS transporter [Rickettsia endosymbiont of Cardiosporidium cionae]